MYNRLVSRLLFNSGLFTAALLAGTIIAARPCPASPANPNASVGNQGVENTGLKLSQQEALREFEAASGAEYTLAAGDEIDVHVADQPDLEGHHIVGPDGRITLPLAGPMQIAGQTREAAARSIAKAWRQYYATVAVTVQVTKYGSNRVVVVGRVASPGPLYFEAAPTLLEALAKSGAYSPRPAGAAVSNAAAKTGSQGTQSQQAQQAMISRCAVYRGSEQVLWIDMKELFASGSGIDLHLRRDDVVYVPEEQEELVSVLGQVQHPGAVRLTEETKLVDVLALSGGLTEDAASDKIRLVRPSTGMVRQISLKDLLDPKRAQMSEISLERGDVIYVPKSGFGKFGYVVGKISPAGSLMMVGAMAGGL